MARLIVLPNPLDSTRRRYHTIPAGVEIGAWLAEHEPQHGAMLRALYLDGDELEPAGYMVREHDELLLVNRPTALPAGVTLAQLVVQALVGMAIGFVLGKLFAPKRPSSGNTPSPSQVYGIAPTRNGARLGEPIPVVYGAVIVTPDYASQPYVQYLNNEQYFRAILCIGQGTHQVHEMLLGDSSAAGLPAEVSRWQVFSPAAHASTYDVIRVATSVHENVVTSADVSNQELLAPNEASGTTPSTWYWRAASSYVVDGVTGPPAYDYYLHGLSLTAQLAALPASPTLGTTLDAITDFWSSGTPEDGYPQWYTFTTFVATAYDPLVPVPPGSLVPPAGSGTIGAPKWIGAFETCKPGQHGSTLELDFVFGGGLFVMDGSGNLGARTVALTVEYVPIDDAGAATGAAATRVESFTATSNTPQRFSRPFAVASGRYRVRVKRNTDSDGKATTQDRLSWTGLKFFLDPPASPTVYGDVTLAVVQLKATNGVASDAANAIRFRVTRQLPPLGVVGTLVATANPADAFVDILCARYGGNRPRNGDELDLPLLEALRTKWAYHNGFNAVFDQPSTVWEALGLSVQTVVAAPLPVGSRMSLIEDAPQPIRSQLFTDANIVAGSLQVTHQWDRAGTPAGVRVEFRDPRTFSADAVFEPPGAPDYQTVSLFGCTSREVAQQHADLTLDRRRLQRVTAAWETELEGLNCLPGQRVAVQAKTMRWGAAAWVVEVDGLELTVSEPLTWTGGPHAVILRDPVGKPHTVLGVTRGASDDVIVLPGAPPFAIRDRLASGEATQLAFGVQGLEVTDWTVQRMRPQGTRVAIEAFNYAPEVWSRAAPHQRATP